MKKTKSIFLKTIKYIAVPILFSVMGAALIWSVVYYTVGDIFAYADMILHDTSLHADRGGDYENSIMGSFDVAHENGDNIYIEDIEFPSRGSVYGQIEIESAGISCPLIYGDDDEYLKNGAGQSSASYIVGYGGTTIIGAHNTRHFMSLPQVRSGDIIKIRTHYGTYLYKVTDTKVLSHLDSNAYDLNSETENIVLYTCYYENSILGNVKKRLFVYGEYVESHGDEISSPLITSKEDDLVA